LRTELLLVAEDDERETQRLAHRPGLDGAASWRMRRICVGYLGNMTEARLQRLRFSLFQRSEATWSSNLAFVARAVAGT
jgi:hypothetical protein